ncbi:Uncharacterised protein [Bordetella pertussis]|nr:Uncharacterised protein [Bordetella pertussis]
MPRASLMSPSSAPPDSTTLDARPAWNSSVAVSTRTTAVSLSYGRNQLARPLAVLPPSTTMASAVGDWSGGRCG